MCFESVVSGCFFFLLAISQKLSQIKTVQMNVSLSNNNKLFLWSQALSSLLKRGELSHTETDGPLTTMAFNCGSYCSNNIATDCNPFRKYLWFWKRPEVSFIRFVTVREVDLIVHFEKNLLFFVRDVYTNREEVWICEMFIDLQISPLSLQLSILTHFKQTWSLRLGSNQSTVD